MMMQSPMEAIIEKTIKRSTRIYLVFVFDRWLLVLESLKCFLQYPFATLMSAELNTTLHSSH